MKILIPIDGSEYSTRAVCFAAGLLKKCCDMEAVLLSVTYPFKESNAGSILENARKSFGENSARVRELILEGEPAESIIKYAKENEIELVIMGRRGLGTIKGMMLGSVSYKVLSGVNIPVTIVK
ncbi:Nucleotide-binding universal stress protein, UspA family [Desulfotomaculum arcticum]|uniref:Nucleotide-binding universal stress protein, UspA family n=1 Tax=Desulfotruncus arcticus DSM 17038 TaxID=1121424 RepID=A0A1I2SSI5_9FIRM|nr:universal stress protein [Desulfotruncus arcticus]SFG53887.1 Nucleotide-binding universal stress protein, UspA family [Desulfotomaculum arcticum] [Desulfotruncus arcticus DSM 17038]